MEEYARAKLNVGGNNLNKRLVKEMITKFKIKHGLDLKSEENTYAIKQLEREVEKVKILLSTRRLAYINLKIRGKEYELMITRKQFYNLCDDLFDKLLSTIQEAIDYSGMNMNVTTINQILFTGGSTRIPKVQ